MAPVYLTLSTHSVVLRLRSDLTAHDAGRQYGNGLAPQLSYDKAMQILQSAHAASGVAAQLTKLSAEGGYHSFHQEDHILQRTARLISTGSILLSDDYAPLSSIEKAEAEDMLARGNDAKYIERTLRERRGIRPHRVSVCVPFGASIEEQHMAFLEKVRNEFKQFDQGVKDGFQDQAEKNGVRTDRNGASLSGMPLPKLIKGPFSRAELSYLAIRILMWNEGFTNPSAMFDKIKKQPFQGNFVTVHEELSKRLLAAEADVRANSKGFRLPINWEVDGFAPRPIAGTRVLSNHTFGLAIDVLENSNPLLDGEASRVIQMHAENKDLFTEARIGDNPTPQEVQQIYNKLKTGSEKFAKWVQRTLAARDAGRRAVFDTAVERAVGDDQELDGQNRLPLAVRYNEDENDLQIIESAIGLGKITGAINQMAKDGFLSIPFEIVNALIKKGGGGLVWGGACWRSGQHRDFMHFDLDQGTINSIKMRAGWKSPSQRGGKSN